MIYVGLLDQSRIQAYTDIAQAEADRGSEDDAENDRYMLQYFYQKWNQTVRYKPKGEGSWRTIEILGCSGKTSGKYKDFLNITDKDLMNKINWKTDVEKWCSVEEATALISRFNSVDINIQQAKLVELNQWNEYVYFEEEEKDNGDWVISTRWVCTEKTTEKGKIFKSRLVPQGFQEDSSLIYNDSPTLSQTIWIQSRLFNYSLPYWY